MGLTKTKAPIGAGKEISYEQNNIKRSRRGYRALIKLGISYPDAEALRRIAKQLHSWFEAECGNSNDFSSWSIERDESTDKPYRCVYPHTGEMRRYPIADREAGAKKRLAAIMANYKRKLVPYIQGDCRGASVYIIRKADVKGHDIDQVYPRGVAVY